MARVIFPPLSLAKLRDQVNAAASPGAVQRYSRRKASATVAGRSVTDHAAADHVGRSRSPSAKPSARDVRIRERIEHYTRKRGSVHRTYAQIVAEVDAGSRMR